MVSSFSAEDLPQVLQEALRTKQVVNQSGDMVPLDSNISLEESLELYSALRQLQPSTTVEIGLANGVSAATILKALNDNTHGEHHVIDPFQSGYHYAGIEMVRRSGLSSHCHFYEKFPEEILPTLPSLQFAFIDASHLFDLTLMEFVLIDKKLEVGGVVGLHDLWMPSLRRVLRYILTNRAYELLPQRKETKKRPGLKVAAKQQLSRLVRSLSKSDRYFSQDLLAPSVLADVPNMVLLRKMAEDMRDWRHHQTF